MPTSGVQLSLQAGNNDNSVCVVCIRGTTSQRVLLAAQCLDDTRQPYCRAAALVPLQSSYILHCQSFSAVRDIEEFDVSDGEQPLQRPLAL